MPSPSAITDLIERLQIQRDDLGRVTVTRSIHAKDLPGSSALDQLNYAYANYVPPAGSILAGFTPSVLCLGASVKAWGNADAEIVINYRTPDSSTPGSGNAGQIEIGTTLTQSQTNFDAANLALPPDSRQPIQVSYTPPGSSVTRTVPGRAAVLVPRSTLVIERTETSQPGVVSRSYVGKTNSTTWLGEAAGSFLCTSITGRSNDGGATYVVTYTFDFDPVDSFQSVVFWEDPMTRARPALSPSDMSAGNGVTWVTVYGSADFNALGLV